MQEKNIKIELNNISFRYGKNLPLVLQDINCTFESGKFYVISGPNGSGKTTLGKIIMGLLKPDQGNVSVDGETLGKKPVYAMSKIVGYTFQNPSLQLFAPTVIDELSFPFELKGEMNDNIREKIDETLKTLGLWETKDRFPLTMSFGEMQRLAIATQIIRDVSFLLLDEPSSSLDFAGKEFLSHFLLEFMAQGGGVIMVSHDKEMTGLIQDFVDIRLIQGKLMAD